MLGSSRFNECSNPASNTKVGKMTRISLPEDNPQATLELCHHQVPPQLFSPDFTTLGELAIIVDKYEMTELIWFQTQVWMQELALHAVEPGRETTLVISYMLQNQHASEAVTKNLILNFAGDFKQTFNKDLGVLVVPPDYVFGKFHSSSTSMKSCRLTRILAALDQTRTKFHEFLSEELTDLKTMHTSVLWGTKNLCRNEYKDLIECILGRQGISSSRSTCESVEDIMKNLTPSSRVMTRAGCKSRPCDVCGDARCREYRSMRSVEIGFSVLRSRLREMADMMTGICLGCCLAGGEETERDLDTSHMIRTFRAMGSGSTFMSCEGVMGRREGRF